MADDVAVLPPLGWEIDRTSDALAPWTAASNDDTLPNPLIRRMVGKV